MVLIYLVELDNVWVADQLHDIHLAIYLGNIMTNCDKKGLDHSRKLLNAFKKKTIIKITIIFISCRTNLG